MFSHSCAQAHINGASAPEEEQIKRKSRCQQEQKPVEPVQLVSGWLNYITGFLFSYQNLRHNSLMDEDYMSYSFQPE